MVEIFLERFDRVQIVFAESEGPSCGGGPGIDQRHLHHVESLSCGSQIRATICHLDTHVRALVKVLSVIRVAASHDRGGDDRIDLDTCYAVASVRNCPE